jgi:hypothetical protein
MARETIRMASKRQQKKLWYSMTARGLKDASVVDHFVECRMRLVTEDRLPASQGKGDTPITNGCNASSVR